MRTTIKDIASKTGFSVTTISLVINGKGKRIPASTQKIVMDAVAELDYRPNQLAIGLVKKQTKTIGLIISDVSNVFFGNLSKGIEGQCRIKGWNLILCNTNDKHERDLEYIKVLDDKGVDGILYCMALDSDEEKGKESINLMEKLKIPFVLIDRYLKSVDSCTVLGNHRYGGYIATKHLIELGHKNIACVTGPFTLEDSKARLNGYKDALEEYGLKFQEQLVVEGKYDRESGMKAVEILANKNFTAVLEFNDMMAYGIYNKLKEKNISVPEDISLVGYDDIFFSEILDVPLTTVNQKVHEMGIEAVQQLILEIKGGINVQKCIMFQPELVIRKSTGKVKI